MENIKRIPLTAMIIMAVMSFANLLGLKIAGISAIKQVKIDASSIKIV